MNDTELIARGTESVFHHKKSSLIVGLTGRTGSGCTTAANILNSKSFAEIKLPDQPNPPTTHEERKDRIVRHWLAAHWVSFKKIHVSQLIALLVIEEQPADFFSFLKTHLNQANPLAADKEYYDEASLQAQKHRNVLIALGTSTPQLIRDAYEFYFSRLPEISEKLKATIRSFQPGAYTRIFQLIGDNLRRSGRPFDSSNNANSLFIIPGLIERFIHLGSAYNRINEDPYDYFVIDALRHPFEILYFRDRLPRFYAIALNTEESLRVSRLGKLNYRDKEIEQLDAKEYPDAKSKSALKGYDKFVSQNIQACLDYADIFLSNAFIGDDGTFRDDEEATKRKLARELCRFVALMQHPGLVTPTPVERCMQAAFAARLNSGCISRQVGAVITDAHYSIKAVGWNDVPRGQVPCILRYSRDLTEGVGDIKAFSEFEKKNKDFGKTLLKEKVISLKQEQIGGRHITYCFKSVYNIHEDERNQVHTRSLHAEENAFLQIVKYGGQGIEGGFLFTTSSPCELCAKKAAQLGIEKVFYIDPYPGISSKHIFGYQEGAPTLVLFGGVIGHAYHELFTPIMPFKDELKSIIYDEQQKLF